MTNDIERRVREHKAGEIDGFTRRYRVDRLVYYEVAEDVRDALAREKQLKGWLCRKKVALIEGHNPNWSDVSLARWTSQS